MRKITMALGLGAALIGSAASAQVLPAPLPPLPLPIPGMMPGMMMPGMMSAGAMGPKVAFKACPVWVDVAAGCMIAVDPKTGTHFSLVGATTTPGYVALVSGTVAQRQQVCPGVPLDGAKTVATKIKCNSGGLPNKK